MYTYTPLHQKIDAIADLINPSLILALILAPLLVRLIRKEPLPWSFWARSIVAIACVYIVAYFDRRWGFWPRLGLDYSTHSAVALAIVVSLAFFNRRWLFVLVPLLAVYAALMLWLHYHTVADMLTTALVMVPLATACHLVLRQHPSTTRSET